MKIRSETPVGDDRGLIVSFSTCVSNIFIVAQ